MCPDWVWQGSRKGYNHFYLFYSLLARLCIWKVTVLPDAPDSWRSHQHPWDKCHKMSLSTCLSTQGQMVCAPDGRLDVAWKLLLVHMFNLTVEVHYWSVKDLQHSTMWKLLWELHLERDAFGFSCCISDWLPNSTTRPPWIFMLSPFPRDPEIYLELPLYQNINMAQSFHRYPWRNTVINELEPL